MRYLFVLALIAATLPTPGMLFGHVHSQSGDSTASAHSLRPHVHGHSHSHGHEHQHPVSEDQNHESAPSGQHDDDAVYLVSVELLPVSRCTGLDEVLSTSQAWMAVIASSPVFGRFVQSSIHLVHGPPGPDELSQAAERHVVLRC